MHRCISTATVVTRTRRNVMLHVRCLSCIYYVWMFMSKPNYMFLCFAFCFPVTFLFLLLCSSFTLHVLFILSLVCVYTFMFPCYFFKWSMCLFICLIYLVFLEEITTDTTAPAAAAATTTTTTTTTTTSTSFFWRISHQWARASSFTRFLDHTQRRTTCGRTPLYEW